MLFGLLHRVAIVVIDLKESIILLVLYSCQICEENFADLLLFNLCSLYKCWASFIFVVLQANLQDMLTIAQRTCTLYCVLHFSCWLLAKLEQ